MKNPLKLLRNIGLALVALVAVVLILIHFFADSAVKIGIEKAGSSVLRVGVRVDGVNLGILGGSLGLKGLVIDNPPGYQNPKLLVMNNAHVAVDIRSLMTNMVNIKQIKLDGIELVVEQKGISGTNLQEILKSLPSGEKKTSAEPSGKKLHIDELEVSNVMVKVKLIPIPGKADTVPLKLKPIRMTNLGGDNKLDTAGLVSKVLVALAGGIAEQGAGVLPDDIIKPLSGELQKLTGTLLDESGKLLKGGADAGKGIIDGGKDLGKGITEGFGGLLKPKKKEGE